MGGMIIPGQANMNFEKSNNYPEGLDCVWVASDDFGHVGAFVTAGMAPVPAVTLSAAYGDILAVGDHLLTLSPVSRAIAERDGTSIADFTTLAERGIYVFDWTDIHRTGKNRLGAYEKMASPDRPLTCDKLTGFLKNCASLAKVYGVNFAEEAFVSAAKLNQLNGIDAGLFEA